jgi:hypothetical protein
MVGGTKAMTEKRWIIERTLTILVTHQTVVYAEDEHHALEKFNRGEVDPEQKPYYEAPHGAQEGTVRVYSETEQ